MANRNVKEVTRRLKECYENFGVGCVALDSGANALALDDCTVAAPSSPRLYLPLKFPPPTGGGTISVAPLREFLYENRHEGSLNSPDSVVWAVYDDTNIRVVVGLGNLIKKAEAATYKDRNFEILSLSAD